MRYGARSRRLPSRASRLVTLLVAALLLGIGSWKARELQDRRPRQGHPRAARRLALQPRQPAIVDSFSIGVDVLSVIVQTKGVQGALHRLRDHGRRRPLRVRIMRNVDGVQSVLALPGVAKVVGAGWNEGSLDWRALSRNPEVLAQSVTPVDTATGLLDTDCSAMQVLVFTARPRRRDTIAHIVPRGEETMRRRNDSDRRSNSSSPAATSASWRPRTRRWQRAEETMLVVALRRDRSLLCSLTFRSLAGDALHHPAARARFAAVQCADGQPRHRTQGVDVAGDRARRRRGRRLRHLPLRALPASHCARRAHRCGRRSTMRCAGAARPPSSPL